MSLNTCTKCGASGFARAIEELKAGKRVTRDGWNGRGMWLELQRPDAGSKMTLPYIFMRTAQLALVPWLASQTDLLAEDWRLVPGEGDAGASMVERLNADLAEVRAELENVERALEGKPLRAPASAIAVRVQAACRDPEMLPGSTP